MEYKVNKPKKSKGGQEISIIIAIIGLSISLTGGFYLRNRPGPPVMGQNNPDFLCCDTGSGQNCKPQTDPAHPLATYNTVSYGLLKSNITIADCAKHLRDTGQKGPHNEPIIIDTSNELTQNGVHEICHTPNGDVPLNGNTDTLADYRNGKNECFPIPNDEIIYLCKANCVAATNTTCDPNAKDYYGTGLTTYDVYYRLSDYNVARVNNPDTTNNGVPDIIKNCQIPQIAWNPQDNQQNPNSGTGSAQPTAAQYLITPVPYPTHHSEQLHTFQFGYSPISGPQQWVRPWCKPAIYLYPPVTEKVSVKIAPKGNILTTIPPYPSSGWDIIATPNGIINYHNATYPYLYYEAGISDTLLPNNDKKGYVIPYNQLSLLFQNILPKLGLNENEKSAFSMYWLKTLPKSNYYFVSIVPQSTLDTISPLAITPRPDSVLRVTLNFTPLVKKIPVTPPNISTVARKGFTVVEWGGLFKKDKDHPFHCFQ